MSCQTSGGITQEVTCIQCGTCRVLEEPHAQHQPSSLPSTSSTYWHIAVSDHAIVLPGVEIPHPFTSLYFWTGIAL